MRNLAARIERLEAAYCPSEVKVIFLDFYNGGKEVVACNGRDYYRDPVDDGFRVDRKPQESLDAFMQRAADIARSYYNPVGISYLTLNLERQVCTPST